MAEPKPINHDAASTGLEVGTKALQYGTLGFLGAAAVGGLVVAGIIGLVGGAAAFAGGAAIASGVAITAASLASAAAWGPIAATGGALFGAAQGATKVNREVSSYRQHSEALANARGHAIGKQVNDASIGSLQQGYLMGHAEGRQAGMQEGAAMVIQQIQAHEQQLAQVSQMEQQAKAAGGFAAKEDKKREQAPAGPQIG